MRFWTKAKSSLALNCLLTGHRHQTGSSGIVHKSYPPGHLEKRLTATTVEVNVFCRVKIECTRKTLAWQTIKFEALGTMYS
ncbi:hypothetical protein MPTK1_5g00610 [Marchantia polymorpha subsp. ruderalis]|uniref:Uncharacterized protein n=2 Tax=Marchantia polymorpha TaxID=3197 RepID=A0AAF6BDI2_MARPO|nr:hypothetical protein MARPO_0078s0060 [Marchantia polymorpha]BBN10066.1 hypothetical protein Mp_5g00610 [Marchantia polymorpha subsp. ruderalis]|eukprot:PTQ34659.1 hypothetical protein MARPO_0078s0060 [Marchantia polymorpha]